MKTFTINLDDELHKDFKMVCTALDVSMGKKVQAMIMQFVGKNADKLPAPKK